MIAFGGEPYRWPPDVTLRQPLRYLRLLLMHAEYAADEQR